MKNWFTGETIVKRNTALNSDVSIESNLGYNLKYFEIKNGLAARVSNIYRYQKEMLVDPESDNGIYYNEDKHMILALDYSIRFVFKTKTKIHPFINLKTRLFDDTNRLHNNLKNYGIISIGLSIKFARR